VSLLYAAALREFARDYSSEIARQPVGVVVLARRVGNSRHDDADRPLLRQALVDAAQLIPFAVSFNDHPRNGADTPSPTGGWSVSRVLAPHHSSDEAELAKLQDKPLPLPTDEAFRPAVEAMR